MLTVRVVSTIADNLRLATQPPADAGYHEQNGRVDHRTQVIELGEGMTEAVCTCGWRSERYGQKKQTGTMDALQQARDAADLHEWDAALS